MVKRLSPKVHQTRARIIEAAIRVFAHKGYHHTKVDEIVAASGTSKGSVYFHFPNKEQIFLALIDEFARLLEARLQEDIDRQLGGIYRVDAALRGMLETFGRYRQLAKIFLVQAAGLGVAFEHKRMEIQDRFVAIIAQHLDAAVAAGDIRPIDTEVTAICWMGALYEIIIRWVLTGAPSPARILPTLRTVLLRSIGVSEERINALKEHDDHHA
jgi:TetR/AcrR family fatty acid metabolism transcriptional regulator